jgi:hypothetical protein
MMVVEVATACSWPPAPVPRQEASWLWQPPDQGAEADDEADGPATSAFAGDVAPLGSDALGL